MRQRPGGVTAPACLDLVGGAARSDTFTDRIVAWPAAEAAESASVAFDADMAAEYIYPRADDAVPVDSVAS